MDSLSSRDCAPNTSSEVLLIDPASATNLGRLSPFAYNKTRTCDGCFPTAMHYFCALIDAKCRRRHYVDSEVWGAVTLSEAYSRMLHSVRVSKLCVARRNFISIMMRSLWYMLISNPTLLMLLVSTRNRVLVHTRLGIGVWSRSNAIGPELNLVGCILMVLRERYCDGRPMIDDCDASNAAAVAVTHLTQMPGVPLPALTHRFDPATFPRTETMAPNKSAPPTVGAGDSIRVLDASTFRGMSMDIPSIGDHETTSEFTQRNNAAARYWKVVPEFSAGGRKGRTLRLSNVRIPAFKDKAQKYGSPGGYAYASLDGYIRDGIVDLVRKRISNPVITEERRIRSTPQYWWVTVNNLDKTVGTLDASTEFDPKVLRTIFNNTEGGVVVNGEFSVHLKASTHDGSGFTDATPVTIAVDIVRAYINKVRADVELPERESTIQNLVATRPVKAEVTPDDVMSALRDLGI